MRKALFKCLIACLLVFEAISSENLGNTFVLRLGSSPTTKEYIPGVNSKSDNSYGAWQSGMYKLRLAKFGIPMKNIVHCYISEVQPYAYKWDRMGFYGYTQDGLTNLIADFNSPRFIPAAEKLAEEIECEDKKFDFIITDDKTSKFLMKEDSVHNILSLLKIGGKAAFTDLDEDYSWQYDPDAMFFKRSMKSFKEKRFIENDPDEKFGLFDLLFKESEDREVDFKEMRLKIEFYDDLSDLRKELDLDAVKYLLKLGNPLDYSERPKPSSKRSILIERLG